MVSILTAKGRRPVPPIPGLRGTWPSVAVGSGGGREDAIVVRPMMYLCLGYDHRIVDGVTGNEFLFRVREILETGVFSL